MNDSLSESQAETLQEKEDQVPIDEGERMEQVDEEEETYKLMCLSKKMIDSNILKIRNLISFLLFLEWQEVDFHNHL